MKTQYRKPAPRKTNRPDQAYRLLKFMTPFEKQVFQQTVQAIETDPLLKL